MAGEMVSGEQEKSSTIVVDVQLCTNYIRDGSKMIRNPDIWFEHKARVEFELRDLKMDLLVQGHPDNC